MSRTISHEMHYDAPVSTVAAMLGDPAFREQVCAYQGITQVEVQVAPSGAGKTVRIDQMRHTGGVPSFARKIVGDETNIIQEETWTSETSGDLTITIPGKPGHMTGTAVLVDVDGVTVETVTLTVTVHIPLIGGKLEGLIGDLLLKALKAEGRAGRDYLLKGADSPS